MAIEPSSFFLSARIHIIYDSAVGCINLVGTVSYVNPSDMGSVPVTQTWIERSSTYLMGEDYNRGNTMEKEWQRDIDKHQDKDWLDANYQNPGYTR